jgi:hypothetical protein
LAKTVTKHPDSRIGNTNHTSQWSSNEEFVAISNSLQSVAKKEKAWENSDLMAEEMQRQPAQQKAIEGLQDECVHGGPDTVELLLT